MCWPVIDPLGRYQHAKQLKEAGDAARPRPQPDRFVTRYRQAGGQVEVELLEGESEGFMTRNPNSPTAKQAIEKIIEFVHKQLG